MRTRTVIDSVAQCRLVIERSPLAMAATEGKTHVVRYANPAFCRLTGKAAGALVGRPLLEAIPKEWARGAAALLDRVYRTAEAESAAGLEHEHDQQDAADDRYTAWPILGDDARLRGLLVQVSDTPHAVLTRSPGPETTDELRAVNARLLVAGLRVQEEADEAQSGQANLHALLESLGEAVTIVDPTGRVVLMNRAARAICGLPETGEGQTPQVVGELDRRRLDGTPLPTEGWPVIRALRGERFSDVELVLVRPDGARLRLAASGSAIRDARGQVVLAIVVHRDVTELRRLEQLREEYVALISHDLRTPLTVVQVRAALLHRQLVREGGSDDGTLEQAEAILTDARRMNAMIQDLLESSRLASGHLRLRRDSIDLVRLVGGVVTRLRTLDERVRLDAAAADGGPVVSADAERIERVLENLVTNALKFSPPDTPVIVSVGEDDGEAVVAVTDRGTGIPPEQLARIFERFAQVGTGPRIENEGLGLGLYIARLIVEAHGGRVWAESTVGQGSTFSFTLSLAGSERGPSSAE